MENLIKGWALSLLGFVGLVLILVHKTGFYEFPNPEFLSSTIEAVIGCAVCFILFISPKTKFDVYADKLASILFGLFKRKSE